MTVTSLDGHCHMRVLLPVRFVTDVDAFAAAYGLGGNLALSKQVEVTCTMRKSAACFRSSYKPLMSWPNLGRRGTSSCATRMPLVSWNSLIR